MPKNVNQTKSVSMSFDMIKITNDFQFIHGVNESTHGSTVEALMNESNISIEQLAADEAICGAIEEQLDH